MVRKRLRISKERKLAQVTQKYKFWRLAILALDDYTCCFCGKRGCKLHVHHVLPYADFPEYRTEVNNGASLCIPCHRAFHKEMRAALGE
jgi:5-methylcytosine-specific restriction endonuclease McrA